MALILNIDTSTKICSVTLSENERILSFEEDNQGKNHASLLTIFIECVLDKAGKSPADLDAISVSKGPGSYTGLRIGISTAKGMAYALSIPVVAIPTLKIMASGFLADHELNNDNALLCPMIDARRMEVYTAFFDPSLKQIRETRAEIIDADSFMDYRKTHQMIMFGDGATKCEGVLEGEEIHINKNFHISSKYMPKLSFEKFKNKHFEDVAYFEPYYLKDFIATVPKKKIL